MKKITLGIFAFAIISLLGIGIIAAFPLGFGKRMMQELSDEEQTEMQTFHDSLEEAIENKDFESWKHLMMSQLTEENFNRMIEMREQERERFDEMQEKREKFCEENECPNFEDHEHVGDFIPQFEKRMERSCGEISSE